MFDGTTAQPEAIAAAPDPCAPSFSIIVPMRNAARTVARAVASLRRQRRAPSWEAILVDDGSTDDTIAAAHRAIRGDRRFVILPTFDASTSAPGGPAGVSCTRNRGLRQARGEWLVFLDADDALAPRALAAFAASIAADPSADVHVGRTRGIDARGRARTFPRGDLAIPFATLARQSAFALHSATVRRSIASGLEGFDLSLRSSEDWDFWMRTARTGARFATTEAHVADYHATPGSLSREIDALARNHLAVLARGAQRDKRVVAAAPAHANGAGADDLAYHQLTFLLWSGARAAVAGRDPTAAFAYVQPAPVWDLDPDAVGALRADAMVIFAAGDVAGLRRDWPELGPRLAALLSRAFPEDSAARVRGLAYFAVKRRIFGAAPWGADEAVGTVTGGMRHGAAIASPPPGAECLVAQVSDRRGPIGVALATGSGDGPTSFGAAAAEAAQSAPPRLLLDLALRTMTPRALVAAARRVVDIKGYGLRDRRFTWPHARALLGHRIRRALRDAVATGASSGTWPPPTAAETDEIVSSGAALRPSDVRARDAWDSFFGAADPWAYESEYEVEKYAHALSLLPDQPRARVLELACAEGHFTQRLAPRVGALVAADISQEALARARARTANADVRFTCVDLFADPLPSGPFDVIFCAEVLYYAPDRAALAAFAARVAEALAPGGRVILTHANLVNDDPHEPGFDWGHDIGSKTIGAVFAETPGLALAHEIATPLYRVQAFVRGAAATPIRTQAPLTAQLSPRVARDVMWDGAALPRTRAFSTRAGCATPILMYHRVTDAPHAGLARYAVSPETFEAQVRLLRRHGFWTPTLTQWGAAISACQPLPGRPVIFSFDDGYVDFAEAAWPILQRHGFGASLFVVTDKVGGVADWDGVATPLLDWPDLARLRAEGVEIGAHGASHTRLTRAPIRLAHAEARRSRATLRERLGVDATVFCYPHGGGDAAVRAAIRTSGYALGLCASSGISDLSNDPLALPRIEVDASMSLETFGRRLGVDDAARSP